MPVSLGISPCPNDTFIFSALLAGRINCSPLLRDINLHMADVEELNTLALSGRLDVTKLSAAVCASVLDEYVILNAGAALGRGCGPLLVAAEALQPADLAEATIAVPGRLTTGNLLLDLHGGFRGEREEMLFDRVMDAVLGGECAAGVIIHEGRFTYQERGLSLVLDLGAWWEESTGAPLPLGVIAARRSLGDQAIAAIDTAIRESLLDARVRPDAGKDFIREHAQEMDPDVLAKHIAMFVNDFSLDLGEEGRGAVEAMVRRDASAKGIDLPQRIFA